MKRKLAVAASILVLGACGGGSQSNGGSGGFAGTGGSTGGSGGGGSGGSGGQASDPCAGNNLVPGAPIHLSVSGHVNWDGNMGEVTSPVGCQLGVLTSNRDGVTTYNDAAGGAAPNYTFSLSWNLANDPAWDGKTNDDLAGKTIHYVKNGAVPNPLFYLGLSGAKTKYYGDSGDLTIQEIDSEHVKGCLHGFGTWKNLDDPKITVTLNDPLFFNCHSNF